MYSVKQIFIILALAAALLLPAMPTSAQETAPKPDLVIDKIFLNPSGNIVVEIRNAGPGTLPDTAWRSTESFAACFVIMIGVQFVDYATLWAADPNRVTQEPRRVDHVHEPDPDQRAHDGQGMAGYHRADRGVQRVQ